MVSLEDVSLEDVKALLKGPFRGVVQFGGLHCAGTLALLSRTANSSMKENLTDFLFTLKERVDIDRALFPAARDGVDAMVSALVAAGADKNMVFNVQTGVTPLLIAAHSGHEAVVSALVGAGADKNAARQDGATPLFVATQNGHEAVVSALVGADADKNAAMQDGVTPL